MNDNRPGFAGKVVQWQLKNGRHDLPWQRQTDPYHVWLSEIMLQQTQVSTVLDYYARFLRRFPDLVTLASSELDDVLAVWSGLGYYSRARNLHRCARDVMDRFGGSWPRSASLLQTLPGIGRSTAAAISAFCFGERAAILDGNVRRVLTRVFGFGQDLSKAAHLRQLWELADGLLPPEGLSDQMPVYTQGLMDIGAMICTARGPRCGACPLADVCVARREGNPEAYPVRSRRIPRRTEALWLLWLVRPDGAVWLERRPTVGVWAGLHCLPVFPTSTRLEAAIPCAGVLNKEVMPTLTHALTHKELMLHPVRILLDSSGLIQERDGSWVPQVRLGDVGLPAPVRKMLGVVR